jgi:hypothetical protein
MEKFQFWTKSITGANFHGEAAGTNFAEAALTHFGRLDTNEGLVILTSEGNPKQDGVTIYPTEKDALAAGFDEVTSGDAADQTSNDLSDGSITAAPPLGQFDADRSATFDDEPVKSAEQSGTDAQKEAELPKTNGTATPPAEDFASSPGPGFNPETGNINSTGSE